MPTQIYVTRQPRFSSEGRTLLHEWRTLGASELKEVRVVQAYAVAGLTQAELEPCLGTIFAEPQTDLLLPELPACDAAFAVEYLPGQFDQRADSCAQCLQIALGGERPTVHTAKHYLLQGIVPAEVLARIKASVINPVESREPPAVGLEPSAQQTLATAEPASPPHAEPNLPSAEALKSFCQAFSSEKAESPAPLVAPAPTSLALDDFAICEAYFASEGRTPSETELRVIETYWSDHCRHTTFATELTEVQFDDPRAAQTWQRFLQIKAELGRASKPNTLMELATIGARYLRHQGKLPRLDVSDEINACTVTTEVDVDGQPEPWLFLFKNETHNHPTEIEPFGGAATCIGGAIRDPLSGRGYVYQAMRITGAADPTNPHTLPGKLPQSKIVTTAARGYSSYGNQIGLATGLVEELYHPGYAAKHLELGAVVAAVPQSHVRREAPLPGDKILLLGGRTGRDGCGGATGSSKSHNSQSLELCGAEVQKGNPPEERKLQRLFRDPKFTTHVKRCNDFGAGGVCVAIGELCDGLVINLDAIPKKYEGLTGTELAISESQERMAIVVAPEAVETVLQLADAENIEATVVATVQAEPRLQMQWQGHTIVDLARSFLNTNGAPKTATAHCAAPKYLAPPPESALQTARGLVEQFDSTIGAGTIFMPFGGKYQATPAQVMAAKFPVQQGETTACSVMSYGFDPHRSACDPYYGAYASVVESVAKLAAAGCNLDECYLSLQEYFERMQNPTSWGKPLAALLGALQAQLDLSIAAIGGKDSMSGSFEDLHVPPTLVSFAVVLTDARQLISNECKQPGSTLALLRAPCNANGLPNTTALLANFSALRTVIAQGQVRAAQACTPSGLAQDLLHMAMGNRIGAQLQNECSHYTTRPGDLLLELVPGTPLGEAIGTTTATYELATPAQTLSFATQEAQVAATLERIFPTTAEPATLVSLPDYAQRSPIAPATRCAKPQVLLPVFPGTNCETDTARAFEQAGAQVTTLVINNQSPAKLSESICAVAEALAQSQILFLPGGFSAGDEPDGSGKFITAFFRNAQLQEAVHMHLAQNRLIGGICNGFQALIKLGLLPFGRIRPMDPHCPTLTFNRIGRHQSKLVHVRVKSVLSPWLAQCQVGSIHTTPISHGEGRFVCPPQALQDLAAAGQIATQYVEPDGTPATSTLWNPNGSLAAIEGISSADGLVFGKMGHSERVGNHLYQNVPGDTNNHMFSSAVAYYQ